jgi:hypothetical protein
MWKGYAPVRILAVPAPASAAVGYRAHLAANRHDTPVPAAEARARLSAVVALAPRVGCDEAFDLALYARSGVELVTWDGAGHARGCRARHVTVKYIPGRLRRSTLLDRSSASQSRSP